MRRTLLFLLLTALVLLLAWLALTTLAPASSVATWAPCPRNWGWMPAWGPRTSPLDAVEIDLDGGHGKLCYGRPSLRGRRMIGGDAVPFGRLWRTGANEPTTVHFDTPVQFGELDLLPGSYSLYTVPGPAAWDVVVNRSTRQWGLESEYTDEIRRQEVGKFRVAVEVLERPVETLTFRTVPAATGAVDLIFEWQTSRLRIPIEAAFPARDQ